MTRVPYTSPLALPPISLCPIPLPLSRVPHTSSPGVRPRAHLSHQGVPRRRLHLLAVLHQPRARPKELALRRRSRRGWRRGQWLKRSPPQRGSLGGKLHPAHYRDGPDSALRPVQFHLGPPRAPGSPSSPAAAALPPDAAVAAPHAARAPRAALAAAGPARKPAAAPAPTAPATQAAPTPTAAGRAAAALPAAAAAVPSPSAALAPGAA